MENFPWVPILSLFAPAIVLYPLILRHAIRRWLDKVDSAPTWDGVKLYVREQIDERMAAERALYKDATIALLREAGCLKRRTP